MPRTPRPASSRRPVASNASAGRPARGSGSMPGSTRGPRSATDSTRCWRRSWPGVRDRETAFERLAGALDATVVLGVVTNLRFLRWLVRQPVVLAGEARTDTLDRIWPPDDWSARAEIPDGAWRTAAATPRGRRRAGRSVGGRLAAQRRADPGPRRRGAGPIGRRRPVADAPERPGRVRGRPRRGHRPSSTWRVAARPSASRRRPTSTRRPARRPPTATQGQRSGGAPRPDARCRPRASMRRSAGSWRRATRS